MKLNKIVLGSLFGDEGKGTTVQWLCKEAIADNKSCIVVRYCGGPQSGHTVTHNGITHEFASFGSGTLVGVPTYIDKNVLVDPICLCKEYNVLLSKGIKPKINIHGNCRIITPYDVIFATTDKKTLEDGTTGHGVYATIKRYENYKGFHRYSDPKSLLIVAKEYYNFDIDKSLEDLFIECYNRMWDLCDYSLKPEYDVTILEGTQGLLLDADNGFYPNVTATTVGLNAVPEKYLENAEVYLVCRTYTTRHGNGFKPLSHPFVKENESNHTNEFQGEFKTGLFEFHLLNAAFQRHCLDNYVRKYNLNINLVVTHLDIPKVAYWYADKCRSYRCTETDIDSIMKVFVNNVDFNIKRFYYSDNNLSNIKRWW